jgi:hypothetical protein
MDLIDRLKSISDRIIKLKAQVETEEATKNAFIMPFLSALGYDVFNPLEVVPEFVADIGIKKGEKVDYCILREGKPTIIIECKHWKETLDPHNSQLFRYFHVTAAKFAILTNGIVYRFYTDLENSNKMDEKPFLEFSMEQVSDQLAAELKKFKKENFDVEEIFSNASDLKYSKEIKELLSQELKTPSEEFVKYFASRVYPGRVTAKVQDQFSDLVQKSSKTLISEMISDRLQSALEREQEDRVIEQPPMNGSEETNGQANEEIDDGIETTQEEEEAFRIVRAILRKEVDVERVVMRDVKSYCGILLDDNNRKPICRLRFDGSQKYLGVFDEEKNEEKMAVEKLEDIYDYADHLIASVRNYDEE